MTDHFNASKKLRAKSTDSHYEDLDPSLHLSTFEPKKRNVFVALTKGILHLFKEFSILITVILFRFFGGYFVMAIFGLIICGVGWAVSFFINDYNVSDSKNIQLVDQGLQSNIEIAINETKQPDIWADGISYEDKVKEVGTKLLKANAHAKQNIKFSISYDNNEEYVAYSILKDRHIIITNQILSLIHSDDELAAVIGHEIAHLEYNDGSYSHKVMESGDEQAKNFKQEFEADVLGATLAKNAGYNPMGAIQLFNTLLNLRNTGQLSYNFDSTIKTHPPTEERIKVLEYLIYKKYPSYQNKELISHWSLYDDVIALADEIHSKDAWLNQQDQEMAPLRNRLNNRSLYTDEQAYNRDRNEYNRLINQYNTQVKSRNELAASIKIILEKSGQY